MKRLILVLAFIAVCCSASAQYIKEDFELAGVRSIRTGRPQTAGHIWNDDMTFLYKFGKII